MKEKACVLGAVLVVLASSGCIQATEENELFIVIENNPYAEMYNFSLPGEGFVVDLQNAGEYVNITNLSAGDLNGFTFTANGTVTGGHYLTALVAGKYLVNFGSDFEASVAGGEYGFSVSKNFDENLSRDCYRRRDGTGNRGALSITCILSLDIGDTLNIKVEDEADPVKDITIETINLNLVRVGEL